MLARRHLGQAVLLPARLHLEEREQRMHLLLDRLETDEAVELCLQLGERPRRQRARPETEQLLELRPGCPPQLVAELACGAAEVLDRIRRHGRVYPRSAFLERPLELGHLLLEPGDALLERTLCRDDRLVGRCGGSQRRGSSPPPRSWT